MNRKLKKSTKILIVICVIGLSLLLYPSFSNYINEKHSTTAINVYMSGLDQIDEEKYKEIWLNAVEYNQKLLERDNPYALSPELQEEYDRALDPAGNGTMGYVEIAKLGVSLPLYHGTSEEILQSAIGHIDWTSLPVGGSSTHCVVSGHRGLPSAKLFTDLNMLREGDSFTLNILSETLTYEVDQIRTVLPQNVSDLIIEEGKDYCTLVTCTPYGINTHRLLVRGHRIESVIAGAKVVSEAVVIDPLVVAPVLALPILLVLVLIVTLKKPEEQQNAPQKTNPEPV